MMIKLLLLSLALFAGCGKMQEVQDSFIGMGTSNDLKLVDIKIGKIYRNNPALDPSGYDYLEFENTQYRIGTMPTDVNATFMQLPQGQPKDVYFKGSFARRSGVSTGNPSLVLDVVDLSGLTQK